MLGSEAVLVDADDHRIVDGIPGRHGQQRPFGAGLQVLRDLIPGSKHARRLDDGVHAQ